MKFPWMVILAIGAAGAAELPGGVSPLGPELARVEGGAWESAVAADGSVYVQGDFTEADGRECAGFVRLTASGRVDPGFRPEVVFGTDPFRSLQLGPETGSGGIARMKVMADGTVVVPRPGRLLAFRRDGSLDPRFDGLNDEESSVLPLFEEGGRIFFARQGAGDVEPEVRDSDSLERVALPGSEAWPAAFRSAAAAGGGKVWVLGQAAGFDGAMVFRLRADLEVDEALVPISLKKGRSYQIERRGEGGFRLISRDVWSGYYWPSPGYAVMEVDDYSEDGDLERSESFLTTVEFVTAGEADGSLIHLLPQPPRGTIDLGDPPRLAPNPVWVRRLPDGSRDPDFEVPAEADSVVVLADGRIQHSHIRRVLADGSPDPQWRVPELRRVAAMSLAGRLPDDRWLMVRTSPGNLLRAERRELVLLAEDLSTLPQPAGFEGLPEFVSASVAPDGGIVLVLAAAHRFDDGTESRILRVTPEGGIDPASPRHLGPGTSLNFLAGIVIAPPAPISQVRALSDGGYLVASWRQGGDVWARMIERIRADGSPDPRFRFEGGDYGGSPAFLEDGSMLVDGGFHGPDGRKRVDLPAGTQGVGAEVEDGRIYLLGSTGNDLSKLIRWHPSDGRDAAFRSPFLKGTSIDAVVPVGQGKLVVTGYLLTSRGQREVVRLHPDGRLDPSFRPAGWGRMLPLPPGADSVLWGSELEEPSLDNRTREAGSLSTLGHAPERNLLVVAGDFTRLGEEARPGVGALELGAAWDFEAWSAAWFPGVGTDAERDSDGDGAEDFHEFAVGSDPTVVDRGPGLVLRSGTPPVFHLPLDPAARNVGAELETSGDLIEWRVARGFELWRPDPAEGRSWRIFFAGPSLFGRARIFNAGEP